MRATLTPKGHHAPATADTVIWTRDDVAFTSHRKTCAAWHYRPWDRGDGPLVVIAHGFDGVREQRLDAYAERFAVAGIASLVFDYRFFGASQGEPRQLYDNRAQLDDWRAAIAFARRLDGVDPERIALWGTSSSGGHVVRLAAEDHKIAAVVAQVPFADGLAQLFQIPTTQTARLLAAGLRDRLHALVGGARLIDFGGLPGTLAVSTTADALSGLADLTPPHTTWRNEIAPRFTLTEALYRPGRSARRVKCPVLVCVADADLLIARKPAIRVARKAAKGELRRYPFGHFGMYTPPGFDRVATDQAAFLRRALIEDHPASLLTDALTA
jgi:pimeloyl-ACP methyl ester carboxylesterase